MPFDQLKRREFVALLGSAAATSFLGSLSARAQPMAPVVGYLDAGTPETSANFVAAFRKGLSEAGFIAGRNVAIEYRFSHNEPARWQELVDDLINLHVAVIMVNGTGTALVVKAATSKIPIVFRGGGDPVNAGLVTSFNRPGGNVTGVTSVGGELGAKRLGLLHELIPGATRFALLVQPNTILAQSTIMNTKAAATAIGRQLEVLSASTNREIDAAFEALAQMRADALVVGPAILFENRRVQLATLAAYTRVPAIYAAREHAVAGGLMSYGSSRAEEFRQAGIYTGRILKGERPADLPVLQPTRFEFIINLQTARTLGITVPPGLRALADEAIE
jgi:putative tryptophan/tyrosine transport system substrate-binding protein